MDPEELARSSQHWTYVSILPSSRTFNNAQFLSQQLRGVNTFSELSAVALAPDVLGFAQGR